MRSKDQAAPVSFFSFQDVLLCIIGITVLLTVVLMILASLQAAETVARSTVTSPDPGAEAATQDLRDQRDVLLEAIRLASAQTGGDPLSERVSVRDDVLMVNTDLAKLEESIETLEAKLTELLQANPNAQLALQYEKTLERREALEAALSEESKRRRIQYIVGGADPSIPIGIELSASRAVIFTIGAGGESMMLPTAATDAAELVAIGRDLSQGRPFHLFFVVKPSGIGQYKRLRDELLELAGAPGAGLDLIPESMHVVDALPSAAEVAR